MDYKPIIIFTFAILVHGVISTPSVKTNNEPTLDNYDSDDAIIIPGIQQEDPDVTPNSPSNDTNFATSLWGAFVFILIGLCVATTIAIFLLRYFSGSSQPSPNPNTHRSTENLVHKPTSQSQNALANPHYVDNPAPIYDEEPLPNRFNSSPAPYSQSPATYSQFPPPTETTYQSYSHESSSGPIYAVSSKSPQQQPHSPSEHVFHYPATLASPQQSQEEEPFAYLDHYKPYSNELTDEYTNLSEISTKRAVLRDSTPYKVIEERVQGEDYDDKYSFNENENGNRLNANRPAPVLSSDSFSDGKTRMVRVLPRFAPTVNVVSGHAQMGNSGTAVFTPVAPPPPPPRSPPPTYH